MIAHNIKIHGRLEMQLLLFWFDTNFVAIEIAVSDSNDSCMLIIVVVLKAIPVKGIQLFSRKRSITPRTQYLRKRKE